MADEETTKKAYERDLEMWREIKAMLEIINTEGK